MTSTIAGDRPQDVGRVHARRAGELAPETAEILERYRAAMRAELEDVLGEIRPAAGQLELDIGGAVLAEPKVTRPPLELRRDLWDLAIKLGRELGRGADAGLEPGAPVAIERTDPTLIRPRKPAPRLAARERRSLGG